MHELDRDELINELERAFEGVNLGEGIGIHQAMAIDSYAGERALEINKKLDDWKDWKEIPDELMEYGNGALSFMDAEGLRFALPAFMRYCLRYFMSSGWTTVDAPIYALARGLKPSRGELLVLTQEQKEIIAKFLRFLILEGRDYVDSEAASIAYEVHWKQHDPNPV